MKSLKRTLSLVLALVMVLGLFGGISMTASASEFTDDEEVQYKEAVDVMTGIGAIAGMGDGTFKPKDTITRAQAAKLVAYTVLGKAAAERLPAGVTSRFTDVDSNYAWAAPSIEYLVDKGVINGMGDGTFHPGEPINGFAIGKMLLCALGYGAKGEYTGTGWDLQVAIDGAKANSAIFRGRADDAAPLSQNATREEVALYCFNAIQQPTVEYISALDIYQTVTRFVDGTELNVSIISNIYPRLYDYVNRTDAYGRPSEEWVYNGKTIAVVNKKPVVSYTTAVSRAKLDKDIKNAGYSKGYVDYVPGLDGDGNPVINRTPGAPAMSLNAQAGHIYANASDGTSFPSDATDVIGGKGILTEAYGDDETGEITKIVQIATIMDEVTKTGKDDSSTANVDERTLTLATISSPAVESGTDGFDGVYTVANTLLDAGQQVPVTVIPNGGTNAATTPVLAVGIPEVVETKIKVVTTDETHAGAVVSFTAEDGTVYEVAELYDTIMTGASNPAVAAGSTYKLMLDKYGYVLMADLSTGAGQNLALVIDGGTKAGVYDDEDEIYAKIIGADGKTTSIPVANIITGGSPTPATNESQTQALKNTVVSYIPATGDDEGKFNIVTYSPATYNGGAAGTVAYLGSDVTIDANNNGVSVVTGGTAITKLSSNVASTIAYADDSTVFVILSGVTGTPIASLDYSKAVSEVYTGIRNVPSVKGVNSTAYIDDHGVAKVIFIRSDEPIAASSLTYMVVDMASKHTNDDASVVYDAVLITGSGMDTVKDGVKVDSSVVTSLSIDASAPVVALTSFKYGKDEVTITSATKLTTTATQKFDSGAITARATSASGTIGLKGTAHSWADDVIVWEVNFNESATAKRFTPSNIKTLQADPNQNAFWVEAVPSGSLKSIIVVSPKVEPTVKVNGAGHNETFTVGTVDGYKGTFKVTVADNVDTTKWDVTIAPTAALPVDMDVVFNVGSLTVSATWSSGADTMSWSQGDSTSATKVLTVTKPSSGNANITATKAIAAYASITAGEFAVTNTTDNVTYTVTVAANAGTAGMYDITVTISGAGTVDASGSGQTVNITAENGVDLSANSVTFDASTTGASGTTKTATVKVGTQKDVIVKIALPA